MLNVPPNSIFPISPIIFIAWNSIMPQVIEKKKLCYLIWPSYLPYLTRENTEHCVWFSFDIKILHLGYLLSTCVSFFLLIQCLPSCSTTQKPFPRMPCWEKSWIKEKLPECWKEVLCLASTNGNWSSVFRSKVHPPKKFSKKVLKAKRKKQGDF